MAWADIALFLLLGILIIVLITMIGSLCVLVPFVPTPKEVVRRMIAFAELKGNETVYDLGCGDARILIEAMKRQPNLKAVGYELPLGIWILAKMRVFLSGLPIEVHMRDLWTADLRDADVVFLYLFPGICEKLQKKLDNELKPGSKVISHGFPLPAKKPVKMERVPLSSWNFIRPPKKKGPRVFLYEW